MKSLLRIISFVGLAAMFLAAILVFNGAMTLHAYYIVAMSGTVVWFATVPFWMKRRLHQHAPPAEDGAPKS